ncbi:MAG: TonB-dependent receptor [Pseudomonas sp.]|uniref:TonB-dependent receptor family protein n=1 Tax=Pseudomonas sp. TaxID=306 RepID=UPI0027228447|nr:TonB-dependent receptor [Pseudomonas sp.]MDO9617149.1 TonB-dependent receptor [Pseudomonas sp.]MDP2445438.1 TonB-dependent receptor [Pseudomonas sp.]MDZ4335760.1 TonB-dependent receptor [Pseudomonas sp.]
MRLSFCAIAAAIGLLADSAAVAAAESADTAVELAPLLITSPRSTTRWLSIPAAVTVIDTAAAPGDQNLALDTLLARVPGVFSLNRYNLAQGLRPAIRGFGARGNFGVRGIRVLVDGVPLTMPDGQTELDGLDLGLVERMEVLRGPASVLYGNAAGGVLAIETREPPAIPSMQLDLSAAGLGYQRVRGDIGGSDGNLGGLLAFNSTVLDGYRQHSRAQTNSLTGKLRWYAPTGRLRLNFNAIDNRAEDPGGLTAAEVKADRRQAVPNNLRFDADEYIRQQRLGLVWDGYAAGADEYQLRSYLGHREFGNRLGFPTSGQTTFERYFSGVGGQYSHHRELIGLPHRITTGFDLEAQRDDRRRYDNLLGERGQSRQQQDESALSQGLFIEDQIDLNEQWQATFGLRYDQVRLAVDDCYLVDNRDDSGSRSLEDWNYSAGLSYRVTPQQSLYARLASSFETPTISELGNPQGGGFNSALQPARAFSRELGIKGEWPALRYGLSLYRIELEDELVGFSLPTQPGRNFYRNAGQSRRDGLELSLDWQLADAWRWSAAYAYNRYRFEDYQTTAGDFSGKRIPGIPRQTLFSELAYEHQGAYVRLGVTAQARVYANDANSQFAPGNAVFNLRLGKRFQLGEQSLEPYLGVDNLLGREYFDNLRINDGNARYFEPGPGRTLYAGLRMLF